MILALILGCDYWPSGVPGVGAVSASKLLPQIDANKALHSLSVRSMTNTAEADFSVWCKNPTWRKIIAALEACPVAEVS